MLFSWEGLLNADKRQQIAKTIISICLLCSKSHAFTRPSAHVVACVITAVLFVRLCGEERCVTTHRTAVNLSSTCEWLTHRIRIHSGINNDKCSIYNNRVPDDCMSTTINKLFATKLKVWCSVYLKVGTKRWWCGHKCIFMIMSVFKLLNKLVNVAKTYW